MDVSGYYVTTKISNSDDFNQILLRCIRSIRLLDHKPIVVIDDQSTYPIDPSLIPFDNVMVVKNTLYPKSGELYPYIHNYIYNVFDVYLVLHDSMVMKKPLTDDHWNESVKFMWYFDSHYDDVPQGNKHIQTVTSLMDNQYSDTVLRAYTSRKTQPTISWLGCFGCSMLIRNTLMSHIITKYNLLNIIDYVDSRSKRMLCERLLSIFVYLEHDDCSNISIQGSIFNHPHSFSTRHNRHSLEQLLPLYQNYDGYVIKTWHGR